MDNQLKSEPLEPILEIKDLTKYFPVKRGGLFSKASQLKAVDKVNLNIKPGETLGVVGESGCGKSTLAKTIARLYETTAGEIYFKGENLTNLNQKQLRGIRPKIQYVFQDPYESLNPRHTVGTMLEEPFVIHSELTRQQRKDKVLSLLDRVGLPPSAITKYPHEFSGGQRQRIGIARAIALEPELLICDEPVSALDVSVQSQIINLLLDLQQEMGLAMLFIAHDLAVVKHVSDRIAVMYLGQIIELANGKELYDRPHHPYTQFLMEAIPSTDPTKKRKRKRLQGELPSPIDPPEGCRFYSRCPLAQSNCQNSTPELRITDNGSHPAACHRTALSISTWEESWDSLQENAP